MLISRGPVYVSSETAGFAAHTGCECFPEPLFDGQEDWQGSEQYYHFQGIWNDVNEHRSGKAALNAFRRAMSA